MNTNTIITLPVSADLSGKEHELVKLTSTGLAIATDVNDRVIGTLLRGNNARQDGGSAVGMGADVFLVGFNGLHFVKVGNATAIALGDELEQDATDGRVVKRTTGEAIGIAAQACPASSDGGIIRALLYPSAASSATAIGGNFETLAAADTLTAVDNGKTIFLDLAGGFTVTLPANATAGFRVSFIVKTAPTTAYIVLAATADTIIGYPVAAAGTDESANGNAAGDQLNFVANTALPGDRADFVSDGTSWHVRATCKATGAITITG